MLVKYRDYHTRKWYSHTRAQMPWCDLDEIENNASNEWRPQYVRVKWLDVEYVMGWKCFDYHDLNHSDIVEGDCEWRVGSRFGSPWLLGTCMLHRVITVAQYSGDRLATHRAKYDLISPAFWMLAMLVVVIKAGSIYGWPSISPTLLPREPSVTSQCCKGDQDFAISNVRAH